MEIDDQRNAFVFALSPCIGEERENEFEFSPRWRHAREFLEVRRPGWPKPFSTFVLRWEKPRIGTRTKARHRGESFRNRIATRRGSLKLWGKRPVESERESRLRKRNCSAARRGPQLSTRGYHLPYPARWNRQIRERPVFLFSFRKSTYPFLNRRIANFLIKLETKKFLSKSWKWNRSRRVEIFIEFSFFEWKQLIVPMKFKIIHLN